MAQPQKTPCLQYCMHYLSRYPKTEKELRIKLLQKGYSEEQIQEAISYLKKNNYLDDKQFADAYVHSEVVKKGKPLFRIKQKLIQKGIDKHIVHEVCRDSEEEIREGMKEKILKEIEKYKSKGVEGFDIIQKLMKKGYNLDLIKKVVKEKQ